MKTFILTQIGLGQIKEVYRNASVTLVQAEKKRLQSMTCNKNFKFEIRTPEGFKAKKILKGY